MKYKNVKIAIFVLCILFLGCINKVKEPMLIKEKERRVELLNNDSIYIQECLSISETEKPLSEKRYALLLNIASHYIKTEQNDIKKHEGLNCKIPIIIWITQEYDYKGNEVYSVFWSNMGVVEMPTRITKVRNTYVLSKFHNEKTLSEKELPKNLLEECTDKNEERIFVINELSWAVLMCKNSTKHIVVKDVVSIKDEECVRFFNDFSCD